MLFFNESPPISGDDFITFCKEQLSGKDFALLRRSRLDLGVSAGASEGGDDEIDTAAEEALSERNAVLDRWRTWETSFRNEIVRLRAAELNKDPNEYLRESEEVTGMAEAVKNALAGENPLETEKKIYEARWNYLEELGTNIFFTLESLIVYYLKLQLLEKINQFDPEQGEENFNTVYRRIREDADREEDIEIESNSGVNP